MGAILIGEMYYSTCKRCGRSMKGGSTLELGLCSVCLQEEDEENQPALFIDAEGEEGIE